MPETPDKAVDRSLYSVEAEMCLLGAMMLDNDMIEDIVGTGLLAGMFALTPHARIYDAVTRMSKRGRPADPTTLEPYFEADDSLESIGGAKYLLKLCAAVPVVRNAPEYARVILDFHRKRELQKLCMETLKRIGDADIDDESETIGADLETGATAIHNGMPSDREPTLLLDGVAGSIARMREAHASGEPMGVKTGLYDLDRIIGALVPGDLYLLAGRPSMGKTGAGLTIARNAARSGKETLFWSGEMPEMGIHQRLIAMTGEVGVNDLRRLDSMDERKWAKVDQAEVDLREMPLWIDEEPRLTLAALKAKARRLKRKHGLSLLVVDYLGLMRMDERYKGDRNNEVGELSSGLKALAKELNVPVLALQQLSRQVEYRDNKKPQLSDLRDSGSLEQDADVVMFVYREEYYVERAKPVQRDGELSETFDMRTVAWLDRFERVKGEAEIIVAKNRQGPLGEAKLKYAGWLTEFRNAARQES